MGVPGWAEKPRKGGREVLSLRTFLKLGTFFLNERFFTIKLKFLANRKFGFGFKDNSV
jgi:hypothetical protein